MSGIIKRSPLHPKALIFVELYSMTIGTPLVLREYDAKGRVKNEAAVRFLGIVQKMGRRGKLIGEDLIVLDSLLGRRHRLGRQYGWTIPYVPLGLSMTRSERGIRGIVAPADLPYTRPRFDRGFAVEQHDLGVAPRKGCAEPFGWAFVCLLKTTDM